MDYQKITHQVVEVAQKAAEYIELESVRFEKVHIEYKGRNNLVSYVDKEVERMVVQGLENIIPGAGFLTEEETIKNEHKDFLWIIDPLDGTTNFLHKLPVYSISIALMVHGKLVSGVVLEVNRRECFYAWLGGGAFLNGESITVADNHHLKESLLATGFPYYNFEKLSEYLAILNQFMRNSHGLRRLGSAAVDLAYVACGRIDGFFEYNLNSWDIAAGALLVEEAGGKVTDFKGQENYVFGREIIAAGPIHTEMLEIIHPHWYN
jgi:myo-inositol-1(or 4)-monophosphatase